MRRNLFLSTVALCATIGVAWAQTPQPGATDKPATAPAAPAAPAPQPNTAAPADTAKPQTTQPQTAQPSGIRETTTVRFVTAGPADVLTTDLIGLPVYNSQNEEIGEIVDMYIANGKAVQALIVEVGGFLGIGERYVSVDPSSVLLTRQGDDWRAVMNTTSEELKGAPEVDYEALSDDD